jgi:hypothetical protein
MPDSSRKIPKSRIRHSPSKVPVRFSFLIEWNLWSSCNSESLKNGTLALENPESECPCAQLFRDAWTLLSIEMMGK